MARCSTSPKTISSISRSIRKSIQNRYGEDARSYEPPSSVADCIWKKHVSHPEPIRELRAYIKTIPDYQPVVMYDGAHVLGILCPQFPGPARRRGDHRNRVHTQDILRSQRGIIAAKMPKANPSGTVERNRYPRLPRLNKQSSPGTQLAMLAAQLK